MKRKVSSFIFLKMCYLGKSITKYLLHPKQKQKMTSSLSELTFQS